MAESLGEAILELRTNDLHLRRGLQEAKRTASTFAGKISDDFERSIPAITSVAVAISGIVAAYGTAVKASLEQERVNRLVESGVRRAAVGFGLTSEAIKKYASELQVATGIGDDAIMESSAILLSFRRVGSEVFKDAQRLALDMSAVLGTSLTQSVKQLAKALEDPKTKLSALERSGTIFTEQQRDMIEKLVDSNQLFEAQKLILAEVESQYGGAAVAVRDTMGGALNALKEEWGDLLEVIGDQSGGGVLRTAVESWISWLRQFRGFLPQISIGFFEMMSGIARKSAEFLSKMTFALIAAADQWRRFFDALPGGDRAAAAISQIQAAILTEMAPQLEFLTDLAEGFEIKSQDALDAWIKGAPGVVAAGGKIADVVGEVGDKAKELTAAFLVPLDVARTNPIDKWIGDAGPKAERLGGILEDLGVITKDWGAEIAFVREEMAAAGFSAEMIERAVARIGNKTVEWGNEAEKVKDAWADINKGFSEAVGRGLHDAAKGFLNEMTQGLTDDLPSGLKPFADALLNAANEWLVQMLANIIKAKIAAKGIGEAGGGGGGGLLGSLAGLFGGGGGAAAGAAGGSGAAGAAGSGGAAAGAGAGGATAGLFAAGIAAAVIIGIAAWSKHQQSKRQKKSFDTTIGIGADGSGGVIGNQRESAFEALGAIRQLYDELRLLVAAGSESIKDAQIQVRHDKKQFKVFIEGELLGVYKTYNQAILAAAGAAFRDAARSPEVARVLEKAWTFESPEALANAVRTVQQLSDLANGISETGNAIQQILPGIDMLRNQLKQWGLDQAQVAKLAGVSAIDQFRNAWESLSGFQESPEQIKARKEAERQILLGELEVFKARLQMRKVNLESELAIARGEIDLTGNVIDARSRFLEAQGALFGAELEMMGQYTKGRAQFVQVSAEILQAELDAINQQLSAIDQLIQTVSTGKIKIGGAGGLGIDLGSTRATGGVSNWHQRMLDALDKIKEFQRRLVFGELSPFTGREKVSAAKATYDRLVAQLSQGGRQRVLAMEELPDAAQQYLELFRSTFGSTGQYGIIAGQVNDLMSSILRGRGIEPAQIAEQAAANANAIANSFAKDRSGRLETRDEALESQLDKSNRTSLQMAVSMARVVDLLEDQNNRPASSSATASGAALSAPRPPRRLGAAG